MAGSPVACPFVPCLAHLTTVPFRPRSDDPGHEIMVIPQHAVEGPGAWFQRMCPASLMPVLPMSEADRAKLDAAHLRYQEMRERRERGDGFRPGAVWSAPSGVRRASEMSEGMGAADVETCGLCEAAGVSPAFSDRGELIDHMARVHGLDIRADSSPPPGGDVQSFFPVRPAETDEGPGPVAPARQTGATDMSENSRTGLRGMLALVAEASAQSQERCSIITEHLEAAGGLLEQVAQDHQAAGAMAVGAVGGDPGSLPESAQQMLAQASRLGEIIGELRENLNIALVRVNGAARAAGNVAQSANTYSGQI